MAATFRVSAARIPDDANPQNVPGWDSLGHIELMLALEMEFGAPLPTEAMIELVSLEAIEGFLRDHATAVTQ
ncbi:MAG: acyl carrier protein [Gemmatimonadota bacterium]|nr:acyl carrier protein [Gemmatimonadota bacterium]